MKLDIDLTNEESQAFAQFLKRVGLGDYQGLAKNSQEAYEIMAASEKIRKAFAEQGYAPR